MVQCDGLFCSLRCDTPASLVGVCLHQFDASSVTYSERIASSTCSGPQDEAMVRRSIFCPRNFTVGEKAVLVQVVQNFLVDEDLSDATVVTLQGATGEGYCF